MALGPLFILLALSLASTSVLAAAGPAEILLPRADAGHGSNSGSRAHARMARSRRGRAGAGIKRELEKRQKDQECRLDMSARDASQWTAFLDAGFRECTATAQELDNGVAMCYRLGFIDTSSGTFGAELTLWDVTGTTTSSSSNATVDSINGTSSSSVASKRSSSLATPTSTALSIGNLLNISSADRLVRRAAKDQFEVVMTVGSVSYRTGQISFKPATNGPVTQEIEGNRTTVSLGNLKFSRAGMELVQSFHFVGQIPGFKKSNGTTRMEGKNQTRIGGRNETKVEKRQAGINLDLSFEAAEKNSSSSSVVAPTSTGRTANATRTSSAANVTATPIANVTLSEPISADIIAALTPSIQLVAGAAMAREMGNSILIDLSKETAEKDKFAKKAFGGFLALQEVKTARETGKERGLVADSNCQIVVGGNPEDSIIPRPVFEITSKTVNASSATATSSSIRSSTSVADSSSGSPTITSTSTSSPLPTLSEGNASSGPGLRVLSTGSIVAPSSSDPFPTSAAPAPPAADPQPETPTSTSETEANGTAVGAEAATDSPTPFALPGRELGGSGGVLPIGLGVFGGVSAVALLVVAWVTFERKKYRKQFRDRQEQQMRFVPSAERNGRYGTV